MKNIRYANIFTKGNVFYFYDGSPSHNEEIYENLISLVEKNMGCFEFDSLIENVNLFLYNDDYRGLLIHFK